LRKHAEYGKHRRKSQPDFQAPDAGKDSPREMIVQIYEIQNPAEAGAMV